MDMDIPDYDMDSEDDTWLEKQIKKMDISHLKFEKMMDRLEKGSGQTVRILIIRITNLDYIYLI